MKIKSEFVLRKFSDKFIAVSVNDSADENNVLITMNSSGAFVFELMQKDVSYKEVIDKLIEKYDIKEATAKADFDAFLQNVRNAGMLYE